MMSAKVVLISLMAVTVGALWGRPGRTIAPPSFALPGLSCMTEEQLLGVFGSFFSGKSVKSRSYSSDCQGGIEVVRGHCCTTCMSINSQVESIPDTVGHDHGYIWVLHFKNNPQDLPVITCRPNLCASDCQLEDTKQSVLVTDTPPSQWHSKCLRIRFRSYEYPGYCKCP